LVGSLHPAQRPYSVGPRRLGEGPDIPTAAVRLTVTPYHCRIVRGLPDTPRYENHVILAEGGHVIAHGRFSGHGRPASWIIIRIEDGKLAEHWDVLQDEATQAESVSGLPMFGDRFPA
jgi:hypothetical protein